MAPRVCTTDLSMVNSSRNNNSMDIGKAAMSFVAASMIAASSVNTFLPVEPALAAAPTLTTTTTVMDKKKVDSKKVDAKKVADTKKEDMKKMAPEEKNKISSKKNLDLAEQTLKEYTKIASDAKAADTKATNAFKSQEKIVTGVKKNVIATSDKLSAAKNQKMPQTAIKELSEKAGE